MANPLPVGHRLDCHALCVLERTGCHGALEPSGAVRVGGKVGNAPVGLADAGCGTLRWNYWTP